MIRIKNLHLTTAASFLAVLCYASAANAQAPVSPVSTSPILGGGSPYSYGSARRISRRSNRYNRTRNSSAASSAGTRSATVKSRPGALKVALGQLSLSSAQKAQIAGFQVKADADGQSAFSDRSLTAAQSVAKMNTVNQTMIANIESTLTPAQRTKFVSLMPELR